MKTATTATRNKKLRMAIARDVIRQIDSKTYKATTGVFCEIQFNQKKPFLLESELQTELSKAKKCEVCAVGSLFLSLIRLTDKYKVKHGFLSDHTWSPGCGFRARIKAIFDSEQIRLIEKAFEVAGWTKREIEGFGNPALIFGFQFKKPADRLKAIMKNIVAHDGEFVPPKVKPKTPSVDSALKKAVKQAKEATDSLQASRQYKPKSTDSHWGYAPDK